LEFIPRPSSLGKLLMGALGQVTSTLHPTATLATDHVFELGGDQFAAPYYTIRSSPGALWGEVMRDMRVSGLSLSWEGANFLRGSASFVGGLPAKAVTTAWAPSTYLDSGPQFISPISDIELPTSTDVKCLSGSFTAGMAIPMDQQWIVGSYSPDDFDITSRAFAVSLLLKITDGALYSRMTYDPAGTDAWVADMMREANFKLQFNSPTMAEGAHPYQLTIAGNGGSGAAANVVWTASPIGLRPGQQIVMAVTGIFLASSNAPISVTLTNLDAAY
jgi:hypothetical protein